MPAIKAARLPIATALRELLADLKVGLYDRT
jgi:hypothetical protein